MRAVLIATGLSPGMEPLTRVRPTPLLNVLDKPIVFYIIESLTQRGINHIDLILHHFPDQIEACLGDGTRWGIIIAYHLAKDERFPYSTVLPLVRGWNDPYFILGQGDAIPMLGEEFEKISSSPLLWMNPKGEWTGWGIVSAQYLSKLNVNKFPLSMQDILKESRVETVEPLLSAKGYLELKDSNLLIMQKNQQRLIFPVTARNVEPGVWISRAVSIRPGVTITSPIFFGENVEIKAGALLGPNVVIENNCIIDSNAKIENSLICQKSYVGESLEIRECIVDRNCLINLALNTQIDVQEKFILSQSTPEQPLKFFYGCVERVVASLVLMVIIPLYFLLRVLYGTKKENRLYLPAGQNWMTFELLSFNTTQDSLLRTFKNLPYLINIMRGELHFVGLIPRSISEVEDLPKEWQNIYLESKAGWITLCGIIGKKKSLTEDDRYAAEAFYFAQQSFIYDMKIILDWILI